MKNKFYINHKKEINSFIDNAINEDLNNIDHSSQATLSDKLSGKAVLIIKENCIIAGLELAEIIFKKYDNTVKFKSFFKDGDKIKAETKGFIVEGNTHSILAMERLVLNCIQRMSGIASLTNRYKKIISKTNCKLLDTRKTTPNFRYPEKWAVLIGGGYNHRMGLYDALMIKDNHIDFAGGITAAIHKTKQYLSENNKNLDIIVEARSIDEVNEILETTGVKRILLDNFDYEATKKAVEIIGDTCQTESSGKITEETIAEYAKCGVDFISVGALTHSVINFDLSLNSI